MKSNFFKKLAAGLALAMVVTSVAPTAATVSAATASITLKSGSTASTVYVTKSYALKLGKNVKATWSTSNKKVATVGKTGGVLKPVAPGKVTIAAKSKKSGKVYKKTYTVNLRAKKFTVSEDLVMAVGEKKQLKAVKSPAKSTDVVRFYTDNAKVATVGMTGGVLTAKGNGTATITAYCKATAATSKTSKNNLVAKFKVTVGTVITSAVQKTTKKLDVTFNTEMKNAKATEFSISKDETKQNYGIKGITVDGKKVTVETYEDIKDGKTYTVTCGASSYQFKATDGVVSTLAISPATIPVNEPTTIEVAKLDANGVQLGEKCALGKTTDGLDLKVDVTQGYTAGEKLTLYNVGNTAKATATYHTSKYDANGNEVGGLKTELTITAVEKPKVTLTENKYTVADKKPNWSNFQANTKLALEEQSNLYVFLKNSKGEIIESGYQLESGNKDVMLLQDNGNLSASIKAVAPGTAYVLIKKDGETVYSLPITIVAKRVVGGIVVDKTNVELSNAAGLGDTEVVTAAVKDQYGNTMTVSDATEVTCLTTTASGLKTSDVVKDTYFTVSGRAVTFKGEGVKPGTYTYRVSVGNGTNNSKAVTVVVKAPVDGANVTYQLKLNQTVADVKFVNKDTKPQQFVIKVAETKGGAVSGYAEISEISMKNGNDAVTANIAADKKSVTFDALTIKDGVVKKAAAGSYTFTVKVANNTEIKGSFTVNDTQPEVKCVLNKVKVSGAKDIEAAVKEACEFSYEGSKDNITVQTGSVVADSLTGGNSYFVKSVTVNVVIDSCSVPVKVVINKTITIE